ncbi:MAG: radical SAM family heme chaperone HemW [Gammaproteobacteria bacterium]
MSKPVLGDALGVYVHLPWCVQKCPYCDFNSHGLKDQRLPEDAYIEALLQDLQLEANYAQTHGAARPVTSIFFGGGTPSLFSARAIGRIVQAIDTHCGLDSAAEITLEANPGAIERGSFADLRAAGVNRISLGAQSFDDRALKSLGRIHQASETVDAVHALRRAGFDNFNLDLMYALPDQSPQQALGDLSQALALEPTHVSHYQLTLEPNTLFHHQPPDLPDDDSAWEMHTRSLQQLAAAGFEQYEVSAYARTNLASTHNLNYWRFGDYLGVGAGAHGKLTLGDGRIERTVRPRHPNHYMAADFGAQSVRDARLIAAHELCFEYPLNTLRLKYEALSLATFERCTGIEGEAIRGAIQTAVERGLLRKTTRDCFVKTDLGWRFLNDLQAFFLLPEEKINDLAAP